MRNELEIDRANRENFRSCLQALSRPGSVQNIHAIFDSEMMAMASVLLYAEVSYYCDNTLDLELINALCGADKTGKEEADYLFFSGPEPIHLQEAKVGSAESPEFGATLIFSCSSFYEGGTKVILSGPGINKEKTLQLPVSKLFLDTLAEKNSSFPMGVDLFLISSKGELLGLPRTTHVEVAV